MTYLVFLLAFVMGPLGLATLVLFRHSVPKRISPWIVSLIVGIAVPAAIVWDRQAAQWGIWHWSRALTLHQRWWELPIEEIAFILLLVLMVLTLSRLLLSLSLPLWLQSLTNGLWWTILIILGGYGAQAAHLASLAGRDHPTYLTYLMEWSLPIILLQWLIGGQPIWYARQSLAMLVLGVAGWFTLADALALRAGIWSLTARDVIGLYLGNVPIEETLFFAIVTLLVAQTCIVLLAWQERQRGPTFGTQWHAWLGKIRPHDAHATAMKPARYVEHWSMRRHAS